MKREVTERLLSLQIQIVSETKSHYVFARDNCIALVDRTHSGLGCIGGTGLMTEAGLCYLMWKETGPTLKGKSGERIATPAEVSAAQQFSRDLKSALET